MTPMAAISLFSQSLFALPLSPAIAGTAEAGFAALELACRKPHFELEMARRRHEKVAREGARKGGFTAIEVALSWLLHKPFPIVPIVGPRTTDELASCSQAVTLELSADETRWLEDGD